MIDLTEIIKNITEDYNYNWIPYEFNAIINLLQNKGLEISYWEKEENWASIISDDKIIGYLWNRYPLLFIEYKYSPILNNVSKNYKCEIVYLNSIYTDLFKIDNNLVSILDSCINFNSFTAEDLWFSTNSK